MADSTAYVADPPASRALLSPHAYNKKAKYVIQHTITILCVALYTYVYWSCSLPEYERPDRPQLCLQMVRVLGLTLALENTVKKYLVTLHWSLSKCCGY